MHPHLDLSFVGDYAILSTDLDNCVIHFGLNTDSGKWRDYVSSSGKLTPLSVGLAIWKYNTVIELVTKHCRIPFEPLSKISNEVSKKFANPTDEVNVADGLADADLEIVNYLQSTLKPAFRNVVAIDLVKSDRSLKGLSCVLNVIRNNSSTGQWVKAGNNDIDVDFTPRLAVLKLKTASWFPLTTAMKKAPINQFSLYYSTLSLKEGALVYMLAIGAPADMQLHFGSLKWQYIPTKTVEDVGLANSLFSYMYNAQTKASGKTKTAGVLDKFFGSSASASVSATNRATEAQVEQLVVDIASNDKYNGVVVTRKVDHMASRARFSVLKDNDTSIQICVLYIDSVDLLAGTMGINYVLTANNNWFKSSDNSDLQIAVSDHPSWIETREAKLKQEFERLAKAQQLEAAADAQFKHACAQLSLKPVLKRADSIVSGRSCASLDTILSSFNILEEQVDLKDGKGIVRYGVSSSCPLPDSTVYTEKDRLNKVDQVKVVIDVVSRFTPYLHCGVLKSRREEWSPAPDSIFAPPVPTRAAINGMQLVPLKEMGPFRYSLELTFQGKAVDGVVQTPWEYFVFVLHDDQDWIKTTDGQDVYIRLKPSGGYKGPEAQIARTIVEAECEWASITLMHRYDLIRHEISDFTDNHLDNPSRSSSDFWGWIYVWMRFSQLAWVDWQRRYNTRPAMLSHATEQLARTLASQWKSAKKERSLIRMAISTLGRGGNQGQAIRDQILVIMHTHHIKEVSGHFYEQWHQKLHNNTTPDDIGICRALIKYLETGGNLGEYYAVLSNYGIDKKRLASYERPITTDPYMHPCDTNRLIGDFYHYLNILEEVHDAQDLTRTCNRIKRVLSPGDNDKLNNLLGQISHRESNMSCKTAIHRVRMMSELRQAVHHLCLNEPNSLTLRDLLVFDFSLETQQSVTLQQMSAASIARDGNLNEIIDLLTIIVGDYALHAGGEWTHISNDLKFFGDKCASGRFTGDRTQDYYFLKALADRVSRVIGDDIDVLNVCLRDKAVYLGQQVAVEEKKLDIFVDEVVRATALFSLSLSVKFVTIVLRRLVVFPPWQLVSPFSVCGKVLCLPHNELLDQNRVYPNRTVVVCDRVNGEEDVPRGVCAILIRSPEGAPDILSHCAVRARNFGVLLAVLQDTKDELNVENGKGVDLDALSEKWVNIELTNGMEDLSIVAMTEEKAKKFVAGDDDDVVDDDDITEQTDSEGRFNLGMSVTPKCKSLIPEFVISEIQYTSEKVGGKSLNLKQLREKLSEVQGISVPLSVALPFDAIFNVTTSPANGALIAQFDKLNAKKIKITKLDAHFEIIRKVINSLEIGASLTDQLASALKEAGLYDVYQGCKDLVGGGAVTSPRMCDDKLSSLTRQRSQVDFKANYKRGGSSTFKNFASPTSKQLIAAEEAIKRSTSSSEMSPNDNCKVALRAVWASVFASRPWLALMKAHLNWSAMKMAVLVQEVVNAEYGFVLHSQHPFKSPEVAKDFMYGEIVSGIGETLVGNYAGRALSWECDRKMNVKVTVWPAKSTALKLARPSLIFRSDSNSEDLDGFAGAGLFESVPAVKYNEDTIEYHKVRLITDHSFRSQVLTRISKACFDIERVFGAPMDIEGCVNGNNEIVIVQSRPQV